jgi:hypothetical protein
MVDQPAPDRVLVELADALRRFEKTSASPDARSDRLGELADALADSGPLELGVAPRRWVQVHRALTAAVSALQRNPSGRRARAGHARRSVGFAG